MCSLIVTAVGCRTLLCLSPAGDARGKNAFPAEVAGKTGGYDESDSLSCERSTSGSGWMTVPPPLGFSTFLIRMGIFRRMT